MTGVQTCALPISIGPLAYNTNHLIVLRYDITTASSPAATANGAATTTLFANPTLGVAEPISTSTITETNIANLDCIKALVINQQPGLGAQISGIRFSSSWSDVTATATATSIQSASTSNLMMVNNRIIAPESGNFDIYNLQGVRIQTLENRNEVSLSAIKGIYLVKFTTANGNSLYKKIVLR